MAPRDPDNGQGSGDDHPGNEHAVVAALEQLFAGRRVGVPADTVRCSGCGTRLGEGTQVSVYAYRTVETPRWHLARCRCTACAPNGIATPTLGATDARISARLGVISDSGTQQHQLCLIEPTVKAISAPQTGSPP